jgi:hypothetical protein
MIKIHRATFLAATLLLCGAAANAENQADAVFSLRNHNPFIQIYGLPPFQTATLVESGSPDYSFSLDIVNDSDATDRLVESVVIDGESYIATFSMRRRVAQWLELGIDVPFISHTGGSLDSGIEGWHDLFGLSNSKRTGPSDQLLFMYENGGTSDFELNRSASGIGDIQLAAAVPFGQSFALRASVKLPSGDAAKLTGSGAIDVSLGLYASRTSMFLERTLGISGFAGVLVLGESDVLAELQERTVPYGGIAARWQATDRFGLAVQVYGQGAYYESDLSGIGTNTVQLGIGADFRPKKRNLLFKLALIEDIASGTAPDFALHLSIRSLGS